MKKRTLVITSILAGCFFVCMGYTAGAQDAATPEMATNAPPKWDVSADLGVTLTSGNSDTLLVAGGVTGNREWSKSRLELGIAGAYGEDTSVANLQTLRGWGQYNKNFSKNWYWLGRVEALHDGIADIDYRVTLSPGVGRHIIKKEKTHLDAEAGISYVFEYKGGAQNDYFALRFAEHFDHQFNDRVKLVQNFEILPQIDNLENFYLNFNIGIETAMSEKLSMTLTFFDTYNNIPATDRESNDIKLIAGLKYRF
jgi:putative salt-induced outer membrane protein YdiY